MGSNMVINFPKSIIQFDILLILYCTIVGEIFVESVGDTKNPVRVELTSRNFSKTPSLPEISALAPLPLNITTTHEQVNSTTRSDSVITNDRNSTSAKNVSVRRGKSLTKSSKIAGVDVDGTRKPEELIRKALINHTLEHGGEEDLDKLVFSTLPQGSKLILRTVKIIRTDENGDPIDNAEETQPTYWDVTLANATDTVVDDEEEPESESGEEDEEESEEGEEVEEVGSAEASSSKVVSLKKKPDLDSSGSHASANYHHVNNYGVVGRDKEHGKAHYHGNTHGKTHKQTHTVTDGKNVKPYHGTEKGLTDYANDHGKANKNEGERYKSSKRKNKGRKVSGFKRVYHKEEFQRTEHFFDAEEANKIAESFGLSEAKQGDNHGTKGDKRNYQGVRTEYLDGKKVKNEHGTHDGYDKGQKTTYKDAEKHSHLADYGKSVSHSHGSPPHHHQQHHDGDAYYNQHGHTDYHPNHNYHGSYSSPRKSTIAKAPTSVADQIGSDERTSFLSAPSAIVSAPMATSFTVTEYSPVALSDSSQKLAAQDPAIKSILAHAMQKYPPAKHSQSTGNFSDSDDSDMMDSPEETENESRGKGRKVEENKDRSVPRRKEPREKKMFFSPKHRLVKDDDSPSIHVSKHSAKNFKPVPSDIVPYEVRSNKSPEERGGTRNPGVRGASRNPGVRDDTRNPVNINLNANRDIERPYAPNFGPPVKQHSHHTPRKPPPQMAMPPPPPPPGYRQDPRNIPNNWRWPRRQNYRKAPPQILHSPLAPDMTGHRIPVNRLHAVPESLAIRHSYAYNKLGNRARFQVPSHDVYNNYAEVSTRKSDIQYDNGGKRDKKESLNDNRPSSNNKNHGVRNTLIDPAPGVYSTVIKVLPATMLNASGSMLQRGFDGPPPHNAITASGNIVTVTRRPKSFNKGIISITTEFPPVPASRPFLPKNRLLSLSFNLGNPEFKLGHEFGPSQHPFRHNSRKVSHMMHGIKNGLLKPFGRGPLLPHHGLLASPSATRPAFQIHKKIPFIMSAHYHHRHPPPPPQLHPYHRHMNQMNNNGKQHHGGGVPSGGIITLGSKEQVRSIMPPPPPPEQNHHQASDTKRPKFYYNFKPNAIQNQSATIQEEIPKPTKPSSEPPPKKEDATTEIPVLRTAEITSTSTTAATSTEPDKQSSRRQSAESPPFINGLMDSVASFFGKMG